MSEIKALEKLRDRNYKPGYRGEPTLEMLADKIEAEISKRFIALPADEDGDVFRIGDVLECQGKSVMLNSLSWNGRRWFATETVASSGWYSVHLCTHVKPRTLEDVLKDVVTLCANTWKDEKSAFGYYDVDDVMDSGNIAGFADEIRELMKEGE